MAETNGKNMPDYVTKTHFDNVIGTIDSRMNGVEVSLNARIDGAVTTLRQDIRDVISYLKESMAMHEESNNRRFESIDRHFEEVDTKLDAIMETMPNR